MIAILWWCTKVYLIISLAIMAIILLPGAEEEKPVGK